MSSKLAEPLDRKDPLDFNETERRIFQTNSKLPLCHTCTRDAFLGLFFDGTNNNKYRDMTGRFTNSASNVARLFAAFRRKIVHEHQLVISTALCVPKGKAGILLQC